MIEARWELGSDYHWAEVAGSTNDVPWPTGALWACGRAAIVAAAAAEGWRRLWVPTYFCQEVAASWIAAGLRVVTYEDSPLESSAELERLELRAGDALLAVNYFGMRPLGALQVPDGVRVIADLTHDPLAVADAAGRADWCLASLRKTVPLPLGAALWSPRGHPLPTPAAPGRELERAAERRLAAMLLKRLYLDGIELPKPAFRRIFAATEQTIAAGPPAAPPGWVARLLEQQALGELRAARRRNHGVACRALAAVSGLRVLAPQADADAPFAVVLHLDGAALAARMRERLIAGQVYPARLWDLDSPVVAGVPEAHRELSRRLLAVHCDARYTEADMERLAQVVTAAAAAG